MSHVFSSFTGTVHAAIRDGNGGWIARCGWQGLRGFHSRLAKDVTCRQCLKLLPDSFYVIEAITERDDETGEPLFWSNQMGWVSLPDATLFTEAERNRLNLPIGGTWQPAL
jgi:hypothetical protein